MATATATVTTRPRKRKRTSGKKSARVTVSAAVRRSASPQAGDALWTNPIVIRLDKKRKKRRKKKKYSRGTKGFQRFGLGIAEGVSRLARGIERGDRNFVRRTKRSGRKKKDGMARDFVSNFGRALGKGSRRASKAPRDVAKRFNSRQAWRVVRLATPFA